MRAFICYSVLTWGAIGALCAAMAEPTSVITWGPQYPANAGKTNIPPDLTNVVAISASGYPSLALRSDGTAVAWGESRSNGPALPNVIGIDGGYNHIMVLQYDGTLVARGYYGTTSNLTIAPVGTPPYVPDLVAFSCGGVHDVALKNDGRVVAWGLDSAQTNVPPDLRAVVAVDAGRLHTLALRSDGTVVAWGDNTYGQTNVPSGLNNVVTVVAGHFFSVALKADGTLVGWGDNSFGQLNFASDLTNIVAISAGRNHCLARRADNTLVAWGDNQYGQATLPADLPEVVAFAAGGYHNVVLSGSVSRSPAIYPQSETVHAGRSASFGVRASTVGQVRYQWRFEGSDIPGATNVSWTITNVQPRDSGAYSVAVTDNNGSVVSDPAFLSVVPTPLLIEQPTNQVTHLWGTANFSVKADGASPLQYQWRFNGTNIDQATNSTLTFAPVSLRQAGAYSVVVSNEFGSVTSSNAMLAVVSVATWGNNIPVPANVTNAIAISARGHSSVALNRDGTVQVWHGGGLVIPPPPADLTNIIAVSAGTSHGLALRSERTVAAWPTNTSGGMVPPDLTDVVAIAAGNSHSLALRSDGTVVGWGGSSSDRAPEGLSNVVEIAAGAGRSLALKQDGTLVAWGTGWGFPLRSPVTSNIVAIAVNAWGLALKEDGTAIGWGDPTSLTNIPTTLTNLTAIAAGAAHGVALRVDGTVAAWGGNNVGQTNIPSGLRNIVAIAAGTGHNLALVAEDPSEFAPPQVTAIPTTNGCAISFPTRRGWRYRLEYKDSLTDEHWTMLPPIPGDGSVQVATNPTPYSQQRFCRVRQQQ